MPEFLTTEELAEMLRASPETVRYWRWKGIGPKAVKLGRHVVYARADVLAWVESQRAKQAA
jgi:excisionase family DNA binding protein